MDVDTMEKITTRKDTLINIKKIQVYLNESKTRSIPSKLGIKKT